MSFDLLIRGGTVVLPQTDGVPADVAISGEKIAAILAPGTAVDTVATLDAAGKIVLIDRYVGSNLAHQGARAPVEKRAEFLRWIEHLEYSIYSLPRENLILYLRVPPSQAQKLIARKTERNYTSATHDIQEKSLRHLEDAAEMYDMLSRSRPWATIQCYDAASSGLRLPEEIAAETLQAVKPFLETVVRG